MVLSGSYCLLWTILLDRSLYRSSRDRRASLVELSVYDRRGKVIRQPTDRFESKPRFPVQPLHLLLNPWSGIARMQEIVIVFLVVGIEKPQHSRLGDMVYDGIPWSGGFIA